MKIAAQEIGLHTSVDEPCRCKAERIGRHNGGIGLVGCIIISSYLLSTGGAKVEWELSYSESRRI
jgi:hypothetical protein